MSSRYALYRWFDSKDRVLYIGKSAALAARTRAHIHTSHWMQFVARSTVERHDSAEELAKAERVAIRTEGPIFNKVHNNTPEARERLRAYLEEAGQPELLSRHGAVAKRLAHATTATKQEPAAAVAEDARTSLPPYVLDLSILTQVAKGDLGTITALQSLGTGGRTLLLPALAVTGASLDMPGDDAADLLEGTARLGGALTAPLSDREQALALAAVISRTGLDPWDAHAAAVAAASGCEILTVDGAKWRQHVHDLDEALGYVEIEEPGED